MREIKFRGRHLRLPGLYGDWIYGSLYSDGANDNEPIIIERVGTGKYYPVDPATVGQFTELFDRNGKEIYEGDILRFAPPLRWEDDERRVGVVVFKYYAFVVKYDDTSTGLFTLAADEAPYTIIGNIHDSPELLEADNERD